MNKLCPAMQDKIADYVLGALDAQQTQALREHLAGCDACREYARSLEDQANSLVALGQEIEAGMDARQNRVIEALQNALPAAAGVRRVFPFIGGFVRTAVAAALILGAGVMLGRWTAPRPVDVEQLHADLQTSIVAALRPAVQESVLAEMDRRLESGLAANEASLRGELAEQLRGDFQLFATQFTAGSDRRMDQTFAEFIRLVEGARLKDRLHVVKALEQMEHNRYRDRTQVQTSLATLIEKKPAALQP